jgi:hypothetical protein
VALDEGCFAIFQGAFISSVFDFNADRTAVTCIAQYREESPPVHISQTGEFREVVQVRVGKDTMFVDEVLIEPDVFGVNMENPIDELSHRFEVIHALKDQVGWIVVETEIRASKIGKESSPDCRRTGDVLASWPFVGCKNHRAVFDPDAHRMLLCQIDDGTPSLEQPRPVLIDTLGVISTDERVDLMNPKPWGSSDDLLEMLAASIGLFEIV